VTVTGAVRRRVALAVALVAAAAVLLGSPGLPASAEPTPAPSGSTDDEGAPTTLREVLEAAGRGYLDAKARLDASKKKQVQYALVLQRAQDRLSAISVEVGAVARTAYRTGRLSAISALLNSNSPDAFLERAVAMDVLALRDDATMRKLTRASEEWRRAKARLDAEVREGQKQLAIMKKRRDDAERALAAVGGRPTGGYVSINSPVARPAPRNPDGSWPREYCTIDDPTTSGCITPRMLHAYRQAREAGFTRYTSCHRWGGSGEHPKGRACDFSAERDGFGGTATGGDRTYGNNLAAFFVRNADRLGVLYVIWYRQIWFPGNGWRSYSGCCDPASSHTNHVHLSVY
jgi:peptidoglycan DL-endopeptidase CwlO